MLLQQALLAGITIATIWPAQASEPEHRVDPKELKFDPPILHTSSQGERRYKTFALRRIPQGQTGFTLDCGYQSTVLGVGFLLHPEGRLDFGWSKDHSRKRGMFGLPFVVEYKMAGQPVTPEQKYTAIVQLPAITDEMKKAVSGQHVPLPLVKDFFWQEWENLKISTKLSSGDDVEIVLQRTDPGLAEFFSQCRNGF